MPIISSSTIAKDLYETAKKEFSQPEVTSIANRLRRTKPEVKTSDLTGRIDLVYQARIQNLKDLILQTEGDLRLSEKSIVFRRDCEKSIESLKQDLKPLEQEKEHLKQFSIKNQQTIKTLRWLAIADHGEYCKAMIELAEINQDLSTLIQFLSERPYDPDNGEKPTALFATSGAPRVKPNQLNETGIQCDWIGNEQL